MSIPANPLSLSATSSHRHVLVAFKYAEDAFAVEEFNPTVAEVGKPLTARGADIGENVVVINEFSGQQYTISEAIWDFDFTPHIGVSTTTSVGKIVVNDRYVPYSFLNFMQEKVLGSFNTGAKDPMSLSHATFMLKTIFTLEEEEETGGGTIVVNPYFFNLDSIESLPRGNDIVPYSHVLHVMGAANTTGLMRPFSAVYQMNITHKDGNLENAVPEAEGTSGGLKTREQEDQANKDKRKKRLDKSKPMTTLKDVFEGLQFDLNQQPQVHSGQLQKWQDHINDTHIHKISVDPQQTKEPTPNKLPLKYVIDLDPEYHSYVIDNRNIPFEQPESSQTLPGIRVFTVRPGAHLINIVCNLMVLSKQIGVDAVGAKPCTFKTVITATRKEAGYEINIKIRKYEIPRNEVVHAAVNAGGAAAVSLKANPDTGPGAAGEDNFLEFSVNDPVEGDTDIISFKSHINYFSGETMLEAQEGTDGAGVVYGDREQATAERSPAVGFYQTLFSGLRTMVGGYSINGLEDANAAGSVFNLMDRATYTQETDYEMVIMGNPFLMSDVNRNPGMVVSDEEGVVHYYPKPEINPMYVKVTIFQRSQTDAADGGEGDENKDIPVAFYYDGHYHVARVVNSFGQVRGARSFYQHLILKRGDTLI